MGMNNPSGRGGESIPMGVDAINKEKMRDYMIEGESITLKGFYARE